MKKIWLITLLFSAAYQLKAQELHQLQSLNTPLCITGLSNQITPIYADSLNRFIVKQSQLQSPLCNTQNLMPDYHSNVVTQNFYSRMPVAKLHSNDPMPIAGLNRAYADNMHTKRINIIQINTNSKPDNILPDFNLPVSSK